MTTEEILKITGIEAKDVEDFKSQFSKDFIARNAVFADPEIQKKLNTEQGERWGKFEHYIKDQFKELGLEEVSGKKAEDVFNAGINGMKALRKSWDEKAEQHDDQKLQTLQTQIDNYKVKLETEKQKAQSANDLLEQHKTELEKQQNEFAGYKLNIRLNEDFNKTLAEIKFVDSFYADEIERTGFLTALKANYKFSYDDSNDFKAFMPDGKPVTNEAGNKELTAAEVIASFADKHNRLKKSNPPKQATPQFPVPGAPQNNFPPDGGGNARFKSRVKH